MSENRLPTREEIKRALRVTWVTFFARFSSLSEVQLRAIPPVLEGKNVMVVAPTASGKTEAVVVPIIERLIREKWRPISVVYVAPTRALVNDTFQRLGDQMMDVRVKAAVKTSDRPSLSRRNPPDVLITTPESLDSIICRHRYLIRNLKAVIVDEIHLIDGTYRGDQMRVLLRRLADTSSPQVCCISATVHSPREVASRYMDSPVIVTGSGQREITYSLHKSLAEVLEVAKEENLRKLVVFCNRRESVELLAGIARKLWGDRVVVAHHGRLSRRVREDAERFMRESRTCVCVATMTLEVGIDIGDIDAVVLAEVPWSLSSLLQRIGRGNRRSGRCRVLAIWKTPSEKGIIRGMLEAAKSGKIEHKYYTPDLSVAVQQIFSMLCERRDGLGEDYMERMLEEICTRDELRDILSHLAKQGWICRLRQKWYATERLVNSFEKGKIHSNIPEESPVRVVDIRTGQTIGTIVFPVDHTFALGGDVWCVRDIRGTTVYVEKISGTAYAPNFSPYTSKGAFFDYLPEHLREGKRTIKDLD